MTDKEKLKTTAYHEGGHAVWGLLHDELIHITKVTIKPTKRTLGHVKTDDTQLVEDSLVRKPKESEKQKIIFSKDYTLCLVDFCLAGPASEALFISSDKEAKKRLYKTFKKQYYATFDPIGGEPRTKTVFEQSDFQNAKQYLSLYENITNEEVDKDGFYKRKTKIRTVEQWEKLLEPYFQETKIFLKEHEPLIHSVANALLKKLLYMKTI